MVLEAQEIDNLKGFYIGEISKASNRYGDKLIEMMNLYNKPNLQRITLEEARNYYMKYID